MITTYEEYLGMEQSLTFDEMEKLHHEIVTQIGSDIDAKDLYGELIATATKYAAIRAEWLLYNKEEKAERDSRRTSCHNSVIIKLNMLARYLKTQGKDVKWRDCLGYEKDNLCNRKRLGDFAAYLVFVNSLNAR